MNIRIHEDKHELAEAAARDFASRATEAIEERGRFTVALAGGSTPEAAYGILARDYSGALDWGKVHVFFGDERTVPPDSEDSNYRMAREALLDHVPVGSVHRLRGELPPEQAAESYEEELREFFGDVELPGLDLIMLGIGEDGHTASLFPNTPALRVTDRWVFNNPVQKLDIVRLTLTAPVINAARAVVFSVAGEGKATALREILEGGADPHDFPAKLIQPNGGAVWMADRAASAGLS